MADARIFFHVDMDAFFASIEARDDPTLRGRPVLVGGAGPRGVVAAASYEARAFGCRSAQPMAIARRLCPEAVIVAPRHDRYAAASREVFAIFDRFSPLVEGLSIDEAFLDMSGTARLLGPPRAAAERLRAEVREATALPCSVGIATRKFIAKIASAAAKPDGVVEVAPGEELAFLDPLPIGRLWGVGPKVRERLERLGVATVGALRQQELAQLRRLFGKHGEHLHRLAHAIDERDVAPTRVVKSIGHEDTFARDIVGAAAIRRHLLSQATRVADRLVARGLVARRVQIKIRDGEFRTETRQRTLDAPTREARLIYRAACALLEEIELAGRSFRLTGVSVSALEEDGAPAQLGLAFAPAPEARAAPVQDVISEIRRRYGHGALYPAEAGHKERPDATGFASERRDPIDE
ncbi:MAG: DNA polymerase IV [Nannocystaceae bacterium]|nr:DNA polymerase IV [Myxococcales bacterium]